MQVQTIIGLEVHAQLLTQSKLFSGCINRFNPEAPNTQTDPFTLGLPGTLPVMNQRAFQLSLKTALALDCQIASFTKWDRKQYFYPDLPKGYQISQFDLPFCSKGVLEIPESKENEQQIPIRINRVHLEDDAGKNIHDSSGKRGESKVDLNRAGTPLLEIVSEPDLKSSFQARVYLEQLRLILLYLEVSDCNMQEGSLRCDANVNLHITDDSGKTVATPIAEVKNMNSFRNLEAAIEYEEKRQLEQWEKTGITIDHPDGEKTTRGWNAEKQFSFEQRSKEEAADYRYFPDPDLIPVIVDQAMIDAASAELPELPAVRQARFQNQFGLSKYDASVIIEQGMDCANYFETVAQICGDAKQAANWITQDVLRELNSKHLELPEFVVNAETLGALLKRIVDKKIAKQSARDIFMQLVEMESTSDEQIATMIQEQGLEIVEDTEQMEKVVAEVLSRNQKIVDDVRGGKVQAAGPLVGQSMKGLKGADPKSVRELILKMIAEK